MKDKYEAKDHRVEEPSQHMGLKQDPSHFLVLEF